MTSRGLRQIKSGVLCALAFGSLIGASPYTYAIDQSCGKRVTLLRWPGRPSGKGGENPNALKRFLVAAGFYGALWMAKERGEESCDDAVPRWVKEMADKGQLAGSHQRLSLLDAPKKMGSYYVSRIMIDRSLFELRIRAHRVFDPWIGGRSGCQWEGSDLVRMASRN